MKTAEEWIDDLRHTKCVGDMMCGVTNVELKQIQLDAMKEGMRRAVEQYTIEMRKHYPQYVPVEELNITQAILIAAEQLTNQETKQP